MVQNFPDKSNFYKSITNTAKNSLNFENCCDALPYTNTDLSHAQTTATNLYITDLFFTSKYLSRIKENATKTFIPQKDRDKYLRNPKKLSYDKFQTIDYWYLILILNGWNCAFDMMDLDREILLPNLNDISEIITNEEFYKI